MRDRVVDVPVGEAVLRGVLTLPADPKGVVFFAHGEADVEQIALHCARLIRPLLESGFGTFLVGLLTEQEMSGRPMIATGPVNERVNAVTHWLADQPEIDQLPIGFYATEVGAAAAIQASLHNRQVRAIVSRGGRLDLAFNSLPDIEAPTLLIADQENDGAIAMSQTAYSMLRSPRKFVIVQGQADQYHESLTVPEEVAKLAFEWFQQHLPLSDE